MPMAIFEPIRGRSSALRAALLTGIAGATGLTSGVALGQEASTAATPTDARGLEEIVVTARKREERLQDVPIAIAAVSGDTLRDHNVSNLSELAPTIPNFHHSEAVASSDQFILRGLGTSGVNEGFEQAVGQLIDGFYYGRSRFGRTMMLDLERLEVLKGPQGALIGKNTSVGAISYTTRKPGAEFGSEFIASYTFEGNDGWSVDGAVDLPVSDSFRTRVAARWEDVDGWMLNAATGGREQSRDDVTVRVSAVWDITDQFVSELMFQRGDLDRTGSNRELYNCVPDPVAIPTEGCVFDNRRDVSYIVQGAPAPETYSTEFDVTHLTLRYDFDGATLSSLSGYTTYDYNDRFDADWTRFELTHFDTTESFKQFSQEIRLTSTGVNTLDYIVGVYFNDNQIDYDQGVVFCRAAAAALAANCTFGAGYRGITRTQSAVQDSQTKAVFAQVDWHLADAWTLTLGGRFTQEEKEISGYQLPTLPYQSAPVDCPNVADARDGQGTLVGFACPAPAMDSSQGSFSRKVEDFSPNVTLRFKPADEQMLYLTFAKGFKSGGYTFWPIVPQARLANEIEFDDEGTVHYELGGKHELLEGNARFNWAVWHTQFDDIQVSALDPILLVQTISNAAQATSKGVEADLNWSLHEYVGLTMSAAYTDASFDEFPGAPCYLGQTAALGCVAGAQDLAGEQLQYAPEWQYSTGLNGAIPVGAQFTLGYDVLYYWRDDQILQLDHDPIDRQAAYGKINATISFGPESGAWRVALVGKNLTDKLTANFGNDSAIVGATGGFPHFKFSEPPRTLALQVRVSF